MKRGRPPDIDLWHDIIMRILVPLTATGLIVYEATIPESIRPSLVATYASILAAYEIKRYQNRIAKERANGKENGANGIPLADRRNNDSDDDSLRGGGERRMDRQVWMRWLT